MLALAFLLALAGCSPGGPSEASAAAPDSVLDLADVFAAFDARGTLVVYDASQGRWMRHAPARASERFIPASTFKVYNALVALEAGVVAPGVDTLQFAWDGTDRGSAGWNRDQSLRTSMQRSAVWVYQEIARRVGADGYRAAFAREPFGNGSTGGGLDRFWLDGDLRISAEEQVRFLDRLRTGDLAFRPDVQAAVREITRLEEGDGYVLHGKTGWATRLAGLDGDVPHEGTDLGWLVGWVERPGGAYVFALNVEAAGPSFDMMAARRGIVFAALARLGLRPPRPDDPAPTAAPPADARGGAVPPRPAVLPPARVPPRDAWIARDKALHFGVSFLLALSTQYVLTSKAEMPEARALPLAAGFSLTVGVGKEVADSRRGPFPLFSWRDLVADAAGVALAALVVVW